MALVLGTLVFFLALTLLLVLQKPIFVFFVGGYSFPDMFSAMWHGLTMDMSVAGYLTALPAVCAIVAVWLRGRWYAKALKWYTAIISALMALACVANAALYPYWGFPLDYTPVFYLATSPSSALASVTFWQCAGGILASAALAVMYYWALRALAGWVSEWSLPHIKPWLSTVLLSVICGLLFIAIRGGVTVSTMNLSRAYFSPEPRLNHAAVNPIFSFLYSVAHQADDTTPFAKLDDAQAREVFASMRMASDSTIVSRTPRPDIHLIIAESFSDHLLPSLGGESVATRVDQIGRQGWLFSEAYASSFRTDRALTAILCGYPGLPTTSLLKYVDKLDNLPSLPRSLKDAGYHTAYYYGGDINFTNLNALLQSSGFDVIVSDKDFPISQKLSKWGAPDHAVAARALADHAAYTDKAPRLTVLQTSSSHEPFDVPGPRRHSNPKVNAFMYTDSVIGDYVDRLREAPGYDNTLIIIVGDHYGAYPENITDPAARHRVPLILAGGAIEGLDPGDLLARPASQTDITATVLALLGLEHQQFAFSNNLLDPARRPFAIFSEPTWAAIVTDNGYALCDVGDRSTPSDSLSLMLNAYMQTLYDDFGNR